MGSPQPEPEGGGNRPVGLLCHSLESEKGTNVHQFNFSGFLTLLLLRTCGFPGCCGTLKVMAHGGLAQMPVTVAVLELTVLYW